VNPLKIITLALALILGCSAAAVADSANRLIGEADTLFNREGPSMAAVDAYRAVCQDNDNSPHAARSRYMAAECLFRLGDLKAAYLEFDLVRRSKGGSESLRAAAELRRGQCSFAHGEFEQAAKHFARIANRDDESYLARDGAFALAQTQVALGEWDDFKQTADRLVAAHAAYGQRPELLFAYGVYHYQRGDSGPARDYFRQVESERARYYSALTLSDEEQYLKAIQQYRQLLVRYPGTPLAEDVRFAIAECFLRSGQMGLARAAFQEVLAEHPESGHALAARFKLATLLFRERDHDRALDSLAELLREIPDEDPLREKILMLQGLSFFELGRESEADHAFSAILQTFPDGHSSSSALFKMIHHYARNENWNQSIGLAHMFLDRYEGDPLAGRVQLLQSLDHLELGEAGRARKTLSKLLDKHAGQDLGEKALFLLTWSYHGDGDLNRIVTNYRHLARKLLPTPNLWRGRTYYLIAESYYELGLYEDAADLYRQVLNDYPFSDVAPFALQGMTASYSRLGDDQKAVMEQERYLLVISNEAGSNPANALAAAGMYFNRKEFDRALELFDDFLAATPEGAERAEALYQSGECLYALQYYDDAVARWRQVLHQHPDHANRVEVLRKLGDTLFGLQSYAEAGRHYELILSEFPEHAHAEEALFNRGNCLYNLNEYETAVAIFQRYGRDYPVGPRAEDAQQAIQACFLRSGRDMIAYVDEHPDAAFAADVLWEAGSEAFREERFEEAAKHLKTITLRYPDAEVASGALYYLSEARLALGDLDGARAGFENYTATYSDEELVPAALLKAGHIHFMSENFAEAAGHFLILADQYAGSELAPLGLFNAGLCYRKLEQWRSFLSSGEDFVARYPEHERRLEVEMQMAEVLLGETGEYEAALVLYDELALSPDALASQVQYQRGECLDRLKRDDEATAAYLAAAEQPGALDEDFGLAALARVASRHEEAGRRSEAREIYARIAGATQNAEWAALARERMDALDQELNRAAAE
jgi:TolA-binding protein